MSKHVWVKIDLRLLDCLLEGSNGELQRHSFVVPFEWDASLKNPRAPFEQDALLKNLRASFARPSIKPSERYVILMSQRRHRSVNRPNNVLLWRSKTVVRSTIQILVLQSLPFAGLFQQRYQKLVFNLVPFEQWLQPFECRHLFSIFGSPDCSSKPSFQRLFK